MSKERIDLDNSTIDYIEHVWNSLPEMARRHTTEDKPTYDQMIMQIAAFAFAQSAPRKAPELSFFKGIKLLDPATGTYTVNDAFAVTRSERQKNKLRQLGYNPVILIQNWVGWEPADELYFEDGKIKTHV